MHVGITGIPGPLAARLLRVLRDGFSGDRAPAAPSAPLVVSALLVEPGGEAPAARPSASRVVYGDRRDPGAVAKALEGAHTVILLPGAAPGGRGDLAERRSLCVESTRVIAHAAAAAGARRLVRVSALEAAGWSTALGRPRRETDPETPRPGAGQDHALADRVLHEIASARGVESVCLRLAPLYGPGVSLDTLGRAVRAAAWLARVGEGHNLRSLTYIDHAVHAVICATTAATIDRPNYLVADPRAEEVRRIAAALAESSGGRAGHERALPRQLGAALQLADATLQRLGVPLEPIHRAAGEAEDLACDVEAARTELGYRPWVDFDDGLRRAAAGAPP